MATGLKVVASSSAGMNNSFEQTIGLMTAITEQTKNASKASRGLNAIMANLAQVLDDASSNGKKITEIFEQLGVEMYENGQLKSGYDLLAGLAEKWNTLDNNSQKYIATTIASTTQLNNFLALMNNFDHAVNATNTALDSQGSAMRENAAYMESIQAKLSQLQSTFQDFANNVISSDLAKAVLDLANGLLQIANTDLGQIVTQIVLLTGLGWGATSLTKALGIFKVGIQQFKILGQVAGAAGAAGGITSVADAFAALSLAGGAALPIIFGVATVLAVGGALWKATEDSRKSFEELNDELETTSQQLVDNKSRLEEINSMPWYDRTEAIREEKEALEQENQELQDQIDKLNVLSEKKARQFLEGGHRVTGKGYAIESVPEQYAGIFDTQLQDANVETVEQLITMLSERNVDFFKKTREEVEAMGVVFKETTLDVYKFGDAFEEDLIAKAEVLTERLKENNSLTDEEQQLFDETTSGLQQVIQAHQTLGESVADAQVALSQLTGQHEQAANYAKTYVQELIAENKQIAKTEQELYNLVSAQIAASGEKLTFSEQISALQDLAEQAGYAAYAIASVFSLDENTMMNQIRSSASELIHSGQAGSSEEAMRMAKSSYLNSLWKSLEKASTKTSVTSGDTSGGGRGSKTYTDQALKDFQSLQKDIKHELEMGEITQEEYYTKLEELVKQYKINATAHMKEYGLTVNQINQNMYSYEEEIYKARAKLAEEWRKQQEEKAKKAAEERKQELEQQKSDYESAVSYVIKKIEEEINKLEQQKSDIEKFYDDQIQALQDTNDELEQQIQYEELLNKLAQSKNKSLYVFSNGQFQYMQDVEAISAAQAELDAFERDKALSEEVENLNKLKKQATDAIDAQIANWEKYKENWSSIVEQYSDSQDKLLAKQLLGIDTEKKNWETRLENVQRFVKQYNSILSALGDVNSTTFASTSVPTTGFGNGYHFEDTGRSGWTEAELRESNPETATGGYYDTNKDYSKAIEDAKASGASKDVIDRLQTERENKIKDKYGGKEPTMIGSNKTYSQVSKGYALGTTSAVGGLSLVGEQGPELRVLGNGDGVIPADITRNLWDWGKINPSAMVKNMSNVFNIDNLTLPNARDAQTLLAGLKQLAYQRTYKRA